MENDGQQYAKPLVYLIIVVALVALLWSFAVAPTTTIELSVTNLATEIKENKIAELRVSSRGDEVVVVYRDETVSNSTAHISQSNSLEELLQKYGVDEQYLTGSDLNIIYEKASTLENLLPYAIFILPTILMVGFFFFVFRQAQGNNNQAMSFGKSRARMFTGDHPTVSFADVAGAEEAKEELSEIVEFLKEPEKFVSFGARIPKGVLMVGSPGTGKTLLAKAVSGEAGVPFFSIAGSEFVEMFVGVGASRVRDLFEQAKTHSPCIIFIDEIDAVGRQRGAGVGGSHDEREQTLNQILVEMDGFGTDVHVIVLAATNRPDILDPALMRPGRFDRRVVIDRPDIRGREAIFQVHMRGKPIANDVDLSVLARATPGFVGADIENTVNEAALLAARRTRKSIGMSEFQEAIERVQLGPERKSRLISPEEREITAYHEAGHAIVSHKLTHGQTLRKITIIPRGMAGGVTWYLADESQMYTKSKFKALIATALGGRIAEEIIYGEITTGASNDLQQVTRIAQSMITQYGMSDDLGLRVYGEKQEMVFLGREISEQRDYSDAIAEKIDAEIRALIDEQYDIARQILEENKDKLELVAQTLLNVETIEAAQFDIIMDGEEPPTSTAPTPPASPTPTPSAPDLKWNPKTPPTPSLA